jgi:hypothetical protein
MRGLLLNRLSPRVRVESVSGTRYKPGTCRAFFMRKRGATSPGRGFDPQPQFRQSRQHRRPARINGALAR